MNVKLLVNRVRPDMIQKNDMMSVKDVQVSRKPHNFRMFFIKVQSSPSYCKACCRTRRSHCTCTQYVGGCYCKPSKPVNTSWVLTIPWLACLVQEMLGIPLLGAIPDDTNVIVSTNRGEPLVLQKKLTLSGIAFENAARRLIGKQDYFIDLNTPYKGIFQKITEMLKL